MITSGGRYFLFFSGSDWNTANYAVGVAICTGPLGPCSDASPHPILSPEPGWPVPEGSRCSPMRPAAPHCVRRLGPRSRRLPEQP